MLAPDLNACVYEAEVSHRLDHVRNYLQDFRRDRSSSVMVPLWNVRALDDECIQVGHKDLSELCSWMERGLLELQLRHGKRADELLAELADACNRIEQRAHADAHGLEISPAMHIESLMDSNAA